MSATKDPLHMPADERGVVRVFSLSMSADEADRLDTPETLAKVLGAGPVDPARAEVFPVSNLDGLGLSGYLFEGGGIPETRIAPDRARLDALEGHVLLLYSRAFGDQSVTLDPAPELTLIGAYAEDRPEQPIGTIQADSAQPYSGPPRKTPRAARVSARRTGAVVFAIIMALVALALLVLLR